jgi:hypothetical protein
VAVCGHAAVAAVAVAAVRAVATLH